MRELDSNGRLHRTSKGGTDLLENLQLLCGSYNCIKSDRGMKYLKVKLHSSAQVGPSFTM